MPALKLSQLQGSFCEIPQSQVVEKIESQGRLPHQTFMQTQAIDTAATAYRPAPDRAPTIATESSPPRLASWHCLPLQQLDNFELVDHQFASQQVWFESAIALRPSNPYFQAGESALTLMAFAREGSLKVQLGSSITEVDFGFISSTPLTISCLDAQGHCIANVKAADLAARSPADDTQHHYAVQGITLNTRGAQTLRIHAAVPFVLTRFWVKHEEA